MRIIYLLIAYSAYAVSLVYFSLCNYPVNFCERRTSFCTGLISRKLSGSLLMFYFTQRVTSFSSNIDDILLINPSANVFVFGDFNIHHKDWVTYSGGTDRPGELCYNFLITNDLAQIVNFLSWIPDCDSHSPALLDFFLSSEASICSTMVFHPLRNSDLVVVSVSIDFPINSKQDATFHCAAYDYFRADWDGLPDHLRDIPLEHIFKLSASAAASEFCEGVQVGIDVYIPHSKHQVKSQSSSWFSAACAVAIVNRNNFFRLY